ncbi:hypothetical protein PsJ27TS7_52140 [Paenibacillus dendritiformis]|uniref:tail fiber protein n=1 Tax=Paenibacillus dendritiformis TaxID=130049 RepID=UPI001F361208|nr:tail fiber protein [Paenibacillus dendritiformis]
MSRYPWRNTSEDIAGQVESQWETPLGAQAKADKAEANAKAYSDEKLNAHIGTGGAAHANAVPNGLAGFMTGLDKAKLDGIEERANHYVHPATHPPSIIAQDANNRFVSDTEKAAWNAKASTDEATATTKGLMPASDKAKLDESTASATPGTLVQRDASGRFKAATPSAKTDVARKSEVDTVQDDLDAHKADANIHVTKDDHDKLNGIQAGAEVNQNAFSAVKVTGQGDVTAKTKTDALRIAGGTGITITTDPSTSEVKVTATGNATPGPHAETHLPGGTDVIPYATSTTGGLMSPEHVNGIGELDGSLTSHKNATLVHGATEEATANRIIRRDSAGQAKVGAPTEDEHIARKVDCDAAETNAKAYAAPLIHTHDASDIISGTIVAARLPSASTGAKGVVQLSDALNSTSSTLAATANAVKKAYDEALAAKQSGVDAKQQTVDAINSLGGSASTSDSWAVLANKIRGIRQAAGGLDISEAFLSKYNRQAGNNNGKGFINSNDNFLFVVQTGIVTAPNMVLREVNQQGTVVRDTPLAADAGENSMNLQDKQGAVGENVAIFATYGGSTDYYLYVYNLDGTRISKNKVTNADAAYAIDVCRDGANIFIINGRDPISILSDTGTKLFQLASGKVDSILGTGAWLSKTKAFVAVYTDDGYNKLAIITRNGTSFSAVMGVWKLR